MKTSLDLTAEEKASLELLLKRLPRGSDRQTSVHDMLSRWENFVREVERGYNDSIYEYTNDLSVRDRLAALVDGAIPSLAGKLERALLPTDRRFEAVTEPAARPLSERQGTVASWWHRVPCRRVGELAADLEAFGYLRE